MKNNILDKNKKYTLLAWTLAILVLAVSVPLNLIFDRLNITFDMTPNSMYTLTPITQNYLDELDASGEEVTVYFLQKMEVIENEPELLALYRTLLAYDEHPCFRLVDFDPDTEPQILADLNPEGVLNLQENDFLFVHDNMVKRLPATMMYTYDMDTDDQGNSIVKGAEFRAENYFTGYIKSVMDGEIPTVYFLTGHGETPLSEMSAMCANLKNYNYGAEELNLTTASAVPEDCCILIIANPLHDLTDGEYQKILDYTKTGGNINILLSPNKEKIAYYNLETLMNSYCIGMNYDEVTETNDNRHSHEDTYAMLCEMVPANDDAEENLTAALISEANSLPTYMPKSRSFYSIYNGNFSTCRQANLIQTDTTAISKPFGGISADPVTIEGEQATLAMFSVDTLRNDSKLIVFGSGDIITDAGTSEAYFINPLQLFLTSITWMYNSDVDMNIQNKEKTYDTIRISNGSEAKGLMVLFVAFPIAVALIGVIVWLRRKDS
ncbi:MAG: GldG family protein [Oscillospiraceae bacterium]|nr:GldG family protein [Oscillospiraceae bacterium]